MVNYKKAMEAYIEKEIVVLKKLDLDELNLAMEAITDAFSIEMLRFILWVTVVALLLLAIWCVTLIKGFLL